MSATKASSNKKGLIPTIGCGIGMLVGGLIGPVVGVMLESETLTVAGYIVGAVGGSILGFRWQSRRQKDHPPSNATD